MKSEDFEGACKDAIEGDLWDATFNEDYTYPVTLCIKECRAIANALRAREGSPFQDPVEPAEEDTHETSLRCVKWGCEKAALVWRKRNEWHQSANGDRTIYHAGWYCPVCGGGYGGQQKKGE